MDRVLTEVDQGRAVVRHGGDAGRKREIAERSTAAVTRAPVRSQSTGRTFDA